MANTRYVDPDAAAGGNGTTNALTGANCAYQTLNAWEAARQAVLADVEICVCSSQDAAHTADILGCTIAGWTTTAANYIEISGVSRPGAKWDATKYWMSVNDANALTISEEYVRVDALQIQTSDATAAGRVSVTVTTIAATGSDIRLSNSNIRTHANASYATICFNSGDTDSIITIWNTTFHNRSTSTGASNICAYSSLGSVTFYNCTAYGGKYGFRAVGGVFVLTNCIATNTQTADFSAATITPTVTYCASEDLTADDWGGDGNHTGHTFTFIDAASSDFHLNSADTGAIDLGVTNPGAGLFSDDSDGDARGATWDIGADEYIAPVAGGFMQPLMMTGMGY